MKFLFGLFLIPLLFTSAFAQSNEQVMSTDKGTLDVKLSYDEITTGELTTLRTDFINPQTQKIQEHIDWSLTVSKEGETLWGPTPLSHTSEGSLKNLKYEFEEDGTYNFEFGIEGILFQPIPLEKVSFVIVVGEANAQPDNQLPETSEPSDDNGGGCLIATATYGSELAPQVQQLRELRDNKILQTESGKSFMNSFNEFYYSFSPIIADYERENPIFKESMKVTLTPLLTSLSLLNHVNIDSEQEMLSYGISLILLNIGMYAGIPVFGILKLYQFRKN
ncbi:MAG: copper-binding protein [Nitrosopumilaceae archaeon]|uniref:Copper-binding protein n=2 Tax=Candidatus Nitrosomaritimum aestuariumsis TaxID=3342354 RepID=A0AC60W6T8_9ARCH|nr:copper-binding protein [Nitrosopumilaceae archaeon]MBA4459862.1 copper-binding protein [Nitrosopumilaceae archaeon]MBA4461260.1 copper-binding protein [Nitrosopumilaceae archaeon]MBA4462925.1 copper-binding protein [Nitrosopumilaceae archaeon]